MGSKILTPVIKKSDSSFSSCFLAWSFIKRLEFKLPTLIGVYKCPSAAGITSETVFSLPNDDLNNSVNGSKIFLLTVASSRVC